MAYFVVPLEPYPDQIINITIEVYGVNTPYRLRVTYNEIGKYFAMSVADGITGAMLTDSVPLVTSGGGGADILGQYEYKGIGEAYVIETADDAIGKIPDTVTLGNKYLLCWGSP